MRVNTTIPGCQLNLHRHRELLDHQTLFRKCQQPGPCWWANVQVLKDWKLTKTEPFQAAILLFGLGTYMVCSNSQVGRAQKFLLACGGITMMTRKKRPSDRTAELLLRVSVKSWKGRYKLAGKGQLSKLCKRGGKMLSIFSWNTPIFCDHVPR
jgi:hypothetical protein